MTHQPSKPIGETPSPQELQAWADEAQACVDSGEVVISDHRKARATIDALRSHAALKTRITELEAALRSIMKATVEGRICDDVAWFDSITTLYDFCDLALSHAGSDGEQK